MGLAVHSDSVYARSLEASGHATWVFDSDTVALAIPLTVLAPTDLMPNAPNHHSLCVPVNYTDNGPQYLCV